MLTALYKKPQIVEKQALTKIGPSSCFWFRPWCVAYDSKIDFYFVDFFFHGYFYG